MAPPKRRRRTLQHGLDGVLARQIKYVRERSRPRVTQEQLAKELGQTQATITRMESGDRAITVAELFQIAAVLNVSPGDLLTGAFTGEDVPVTASLKVPPSVARGWLDGVTALPGADEDAFFVLNIPPSRARTIYGKVRMEIQAQRDAGAAAAQQRAAAALEEPDDAS
jgi:transcriptional regulator with XRE-family HTH domain